MKRAGMLIGTLCLVTLFGRVCAADVYDIDPAHSRITFKVRHLAISTVEGRFVKFSGTFAGDPKNISTGKTSATIDVASVFTDQTQRDAHLKSKDFFDVAAFPVITFKSTKVEPIDAQHFKLTGDLTIHGVTKPVTLDVEAGGMAKDPMGNERAAYSALTTINRKDFGLNYNAVLETGGLLVGEDVKIEIQVEGIKQK
jgi:polyisoprenoid-binding protein YceI